MPDSSPPPAPSPATTPGTMSEQDQGWTKKGQRQAPVLPASESPVARLTRLRTTGFRKLRDGRIHVRCYSCGRKVSNTTRMEYDPPTAVLIETPCEKCSQGCKDPPSYYYDATGAEVEEPDPYCVDCGCYLADGMIPRSEDDPRQCDDCAYDAETDFDAGSVVLAVDPSWSTPNTEPAS